MTNVNRKNIKTVQGSRSLRRILLRQSCSSYSVGALLPYRVYLQREFVFINTVFRILSITCGIITFNNTHCVSVASCSRDCVRYAVGSAGYVCVCVLSSF